MEHSAMRVLPDRSSPSLIAHLLVNGSARQRSIWFQRSRPAPIRAVDIAGALVTGSPRSIVAGDVVGPDDRIEPVRHLRRLRSGRWNAAAKRGRSRLMSSGSDPPSRGRARLRFRAAAAAPRSPSARAGGPRPNGLLPAVAAVRTLAVSVALPRAREGAFTSSTIFIRDRRDAPPTQPDIKQGGTARRFRPCRGAA
jgi:hypothetical protein